MAFFISPSSAKRMSTSSTYYLFRLRIFGVEEEKLKMLKKKPTQQQIRKAQHLFPFESFLQDSLHNISLSSVY